MNKLFFLSFLIFFSLSRQDNACSRLSFEASSPGFQDSDFETMKEYFLKNLNIAGKGAVVASPDPKTPGGSYYYNWERDAALSMKAFMFINDFDFKSIENYMNSYVDWVLHVHSSQDPNNIDIRIEVKFNLPDGSVFTGGWCRPQTDAPGLRATTLSLYSQELIKNGKESFVKEKLWTGSGNGGAIKYDLDWVVNNWRQNSCDLWEEIRADDLFWGRFTMRRGLLEGAKIAEHFGDRDSANKYRQVAKDIENVLDAHWTGAFIKESDNRQKDSAVVSAFSEGFADDNVFKPTDAKVAGTVKALNDLFCNSFNINQQDINNKIPGILYGRYEGDNYAGGNPWILLTADLARLYYRVGKQILDDKANGNLADINYDAWYQAINKSNSGNFLGDKDLSLAKSMLSAGDAVLSRIYYHVKNDNVHLAEQLDRNTGYQVSAKDLSWSYSSVLVALKVRAHLLEKLNVSDA